MSLDELINGESEDQADDDDNSSVSEAEGLKDFSRVKFQKHKLHKSGLCPDCGKDKTEKVEYYWRCNNDNCDTLTYFSPDYKVSL